SAIVSVPRPDAARRLAEAGVVSATRAGAARVSFHLYNTEADVERALAAPRAWSRRYCRPGNTGIVGVRPVAARPRAQRRVAALPASRAGWRRARSRERSSTDRHAAIVSLSATTASSAADAASVTGRGVA